MARASIRWHFANRTVAEPRPRVYQAWNRREIIVITQVLAHEINLGYHLMREMVVERINGIEIAEMRDVQRAFASPRGNFHVVDTDCHGPRSESNRSDYHAAY